MFVKNVKPGERPEWLQRAGSGIERGETLVGIFETERFAIVKFPGHTYWTGNFLPRGYAQTEYRLLRKGKDIISAQTVHVGRPKNVDYATMKLALQRAEKETP